MLTRAIRHFAAIIILSGAAQAEDSAQFAAALAESARSAWPAAEAAARASGPLAADFIAWQRLRAGEGAFVEYIDFLSRHPDWPGLPMLRKAGEVAIPPDGNPEAVIGFFNEAEPQTGWGSLSLARAFRAKGDSAAAEKEIVRSWRTHPMNPAAQALVMQEWGAVLAPHHDGRMAAMLKAGELDSARQMLGLASAATRTVAEARIALQAGEKGVEAFLAKVPADRMGSAGLARDRFKWRMRKGLTREAGDLLLERSGSAEGLGDPADWADGRRKLARAEMRGGSAQRAYRLAAHHHLKPSDGFDYADLEFLSGYIALRLLKDPETAIKHFHHLEGGVQSSISVARANYWLGRAYEAEQKGEDARRHYAIAAKGQTAFYGLLAAEKLGLPLDPALAGTESYPDWRAQGFVNSSVFQTAVALKAAGDDLQSVRFLLHLNETLTPQEGAALMGMALEWKSPLHALLLAKAESDENLVYPGALFPLNGIEALTLPVPKPLALSITRRESEFYQYSRSPSGALGLMQLMPPTAKEVAGKLGLPFDQGRLTKDPMYNVALGAMYLKEIRDQFGPSPLLVASAYNAGPSRPKRWITEMGDPRNDSVDPVDWVEMIPIPETQTYVMRVTEGIVVYRERLGIGGGPVRMTDILRGRH